ncbi:hypothetical protein, partial [Actinomadura viridis]|uniref:hypothetical protein n=1 Tax=Actinomadura viridis TaxID=58110 RepID=UPI0031E9CF22
MTIRTTNENLNPPISRTMRSRITRHLQQTTIRKRTMTTQILPDRPITIPSHLPYMPQVTIRTTNENLNPPISRTMRSRITRHLQQTTIRKRTMTTQILPDRP